MRPTPLHLASSKQHSPRKRARTSTAQHGSIPARLLLGILGAVFGVGILGAGVAFGYWLTTDSSSNPAYTIADTLPTGQTPGTPVTTPNPNSNKVQITFAQASTSTGHVAIPASDYILKRYPAAGGAAVSVTSSCSGTGTINLHGIRCARWRVGLHRHTDLRSELDRY